MLIGHCEWCSLPKLGLPGIKAKIDTGAQTSALHAFNINSFHQNGLRKVHFEIQPLQANRRITIQCVGNVIDERLIMSSNGYNESRYVIETPIILGGYQYPIQLTLSNREPLKYRMLLGRQALNCFFLVDPAQRLITGKAYFYELYRYYQQSS